MRLASVAQRGPFVANALAWAMALALASVPARAADAPANDAAYDPFLAFDAAAGETAAAGGGAAEPYRDRIIASAELEDLPPDEDETVASGGAPRAAHVDVVASRSRIAGSESNEFGLAFGGFMETNDLGAVSIEGVVFHGDRMAEGDASWRGRATLWQRGLAMPGGWSVDSGLGVVNTALPRLLQDQYRFFLPSVPLLGLASEWTLKERGLSWQVAAGRGGVFNGGVINGFETGDGSAASAGAQWNWSPDWSGAVSLLATDGRIVPASQGLPGLQNGDTRALVFGNRWRGTRDELGIMVQASDTAADTSTGAWFDARASRGRWTHRYGAFHLEPGLAWGAWPINNDVRGAYYRLDFNRARWSWNASIDRIDSISGEGFGGWYSSAFLRYQASTRLAYGGSLSARANSNGAQDRAEAVQLFADTRSRWGQTRAQVDLARSDGSADSWELTLDQSLPLREGSRLSLSAGYGEIADGASAASPSITLAAYGGLSLGQALTVDGSLRWRRLDRDQASSGMDISLGIRWQMSQRWSLAANVVENRGPWTSPFILDPLGNPMLPADVSADRSIYASLRYDFSAGRARPVLGGPVGGATGDIVGSVYLDENGDGQRSASEPAARNVTVTLDGRYVARTDELGRFRFDRVAVGSHALEVIQDNLPLPWTFDGQAARRTVAVVVRQDAVVDFGARRPR